MNDKEIEFINNVVSYVHRYFRDDHLLLEIVAEAVEHAIGVNQGIANSSTQEPAEVIK